jgi:hypothetical protein
VEEPDHGIEARAALFRAEMAALPDWRDTLVVSHWGFILAMTGERVMNGDGSAATRPAGAGGDPVARAAPGRGEALTRTGPAAPGRRGFRPRGAS